MESLTDIPCLRNSPLAFLNLDLNAPLPPGLGTRQHCVCASCPTAIQCSKPRRWLKMYNKYDTTFLSHSTVAGISNWVSLQLVCVLVRNCIFICYFVQRFSPGMRLAALLAPARNISILQISRRKTLSMFGEHILIFDTKDSLTLYSCQWQFVPRDIGEIENRRVQLMNNEICC